MKEGYREPLKNLSVAQQPEAMRKAITAARKELPPGTGVIVFAFDYGEGGGMAYASTAQRADCIKMLEEWIAYQRTLS
jgi:hypothetical protein